MATTETITINGHTYTRTGNSVQKNGVPYSWKALAADLKIPYHTLMSRKSLHPHEILSDLVRLTVPNYNTKKKTPAKNISVVNQLLRQPLLGNNITQPDTTLQTLKLKAKRAQERATAAAEEAEAAEIALHNYVLAKQRAAA